MTMLEACKERNEALFSLDREKTEEERGREG